MSTRLAFRVKSGYGVAELGMMSAEILIRVYLLKFYTDSVGLRPELAGYAVAIGVLWDGVTDPLMGILSDRMKTPFGRRIPLMLLGALILPPALYLVFNPPELTTQGGRFQYLVLTYILFNTALTILSVPHSALAGDMSDDSDERLQLFGFRLFSGNLGLVIGSLLPGLFAASAVSQNTEGSSAMVAGGLILVTALITIMATKNHDGTRAAVTPKKKPKKKSWLMLNRPFLTLFTAYFIATLGLTINSSLALYYYSYRLQLEQVTVNFIIAFFILIFCLSIPLWIVIARRWGKKWPLVVGVGGLALMSSIVYPLFPPGHAGWPYLAGFLGGIFVGAVVLLDAALAEVVDYDQVWSGAPRFGLYFGWWKLGGKASRAMALALTGILLDRIGFIPNQEQSAEVAWKLALAFGPGVGIFLLIGAAIATTYPLSEAKHNQVKRILTGSALIPEGQPSSDQREEF